MSMLDQALELWEHGFHVIPCGSPLEEVPAYFIEKNGGDEAAARQKWPKTPRVRWAEFQTRCPTEEEVREWWGRWPHANIAIITGTPGGVDVVDADCEEAIRWVEENLTRTPWQVKTKKGRHFYYLRGEIDIRNTANPNVGLDTRGEGGYVIAAGSTHESGYVYEWLRDEHYDADHPVDLPSLTGQDVERIRSYGGARITQGSGFVDTDVSHIRLGPLDWSPEQEGGRNNKAAALAGKLIQEGDDIQTIRFKLLQWNEGNSPPLSVAEIEQTLRSVVGTHQRNNPDAVIRTAPLPKSDEADGLIHVWSVGELLDQPPEKPEFLWGGPAFFRGCRMLIAGAPKTGKSRFALSFAASLASGTPFLDAEVARPVKVLWLQAEIHKAWLPERIRPIVQGMVARNGGAIDRLRRHLKMTGRVRLDLLNPADYLLLREICRGEGLDVLIVDPLTNFTSADENSNTEMRRLLDAVDALQAETGICIVLIHHIKKAQHKYEVGGQQSSPFDAIRGASATRGWYDTGCILAPTDVAQELSVSWELRNGEPWPAHNVRWNDETGLYDRLSFAMPPPAAPVQLHQDTTQSRAQEMERALRTLFDPGVAVSSADLKDAIDREWCQIKAHWSRVTGAFRAMPGCFAEPDETAKGHPYKYWVQPL